MTHNLAEMKRRLLRWFVGAKRDLPWRVSRDPYRVLLAEFMLQQTRVDTVIPYFESFVRRFPTVQDLAGAEQDEILKSWEGMGYYARARNLHRAANSIVRDHGGHVPDSYEELSSLPGFGPYTTAAVLSIAYDQNHAVVDGNVIRLLSRLFGIREDVTRAHARRRLQDHASQFLGKGDAGTFNQAMMELGSTVCTPTKPHCAECPLSQYCDALLAGDGESLPLKPKAKRIPHRVMCAGIVWRKSKVLIVQRPEEGLLGGMWEFPAARRARSETYGECCLRAVHENTSVHASVYRRYRTVKQAFSHFRVTIHSFHCRFDGGRARAAVCSKAIWVSRANLDRLAFSSANRKLVNAILESGHDPFKKQPSEEVSHAT